MGGCAHGMRCAGRVAGLGSLATDYRARLAGVWTTLSVAGKPLGDWCQECWALQHQHWPHSRQTLPQVLDGLTNRRGGKSWAEAGLVRPRQVRFRSCQHPTASCRLPTQPPTVQPAFSCMCNVLCGLAWRSALAPSFFSSWAGQAAVLRSSTTAQPPVAWPGCADRLHRWAGLQLLWACSC